MRQQNRERRHARYSEVMAPHEQGAPIRSIALRLGMEHHTVRRLVRADTCPERRTPRPRRSLLDPFKPYLHQRWEAGCHNAAQLVREIRSHGYSGSESSVRHYIGRLRATLPTELQRLHRTHGPRSPAPMMRVETPSPRQASWLLLYPEKSLLQAMEKAGVQREREQKTLLRYLCALCPEIDIAQQLGRRFIHVMKERRTEELALWLQEALQTDIPELRTFATGINREKAAIANALA